jgi:hypothetical protein
MDRKLCRFQMRHAIDPFVDRLWREKNTAIKAPFSTIAPAEQVYLDINSLSPQTELQACICRVGRQAPSRWCCRKTSPPIWPPGTPDRGQCGDAAGVGASVPIEISLLSSRVVHSRANRRAQLRRGHDPDRHNEACRPSNRQQQSVTMRRYTGWLPLLQNVRQ